ncbi:MAG: hypothetical protein WC661_14900 [Opitutaceae bacterium]|jgi:hypothetical protein
MVALITCAAPLLIPSWSRQLFRDDQVRYADNSTEVAEWAEVKARVLKNNKTRPAAFGSGLAHAVFFLVIILIAANARLSADFIFQHDARTVLVSAQDKEGNVWAIGFPEALLRWTPEGWTEVGSAKEWEGSRSHRWALGAALNEKLMSMDGPNAGVLAMWPSPEGGVESLWEAHDPLKKRTPPDAGSRASAYDPNRGAGLFHYRHTLTQTCQPLHKSHRSWIQPVNALENDYRFYHEWESAPIYRVATVKGAPWFLTSRTEWAASLALWTFADEPDGLRSFPATALKFSGLYQPRIQPDAFGAVWLWGEQIGPSSWRSKTKGEPTRFFARFADLQFDFQPVIDGFPKEDVTEFVAIDNGTRAVAGVEGKGLWTIDLAARRAQPRHSPPLPEQCKIWSWQGWDDGMEAVLASDPDDQSGNRHDAFWAVPWIKQDGIWRAHGRFRVDNWHGSGERAVPGRKLSWLRWDGHLILTGPRPVYVLALKSLDATIEKLDSIRGFSGRNSQAAYLLSTDEVLIVGSTAVVLKPGELARSLRAAPSPIITLRDAFRGNRDAILALTLTGPKDRQVDYWDGQRLHTWPVPDESGSSLMQDSQDVLWLAGKPEALAWTLDPKEPSPQWKRHDRLLDLVAAYSGSTQERTMKMAPTDARDGPAFHGDGQALLWAGGGNYDHLSAAGWKRLTPLKLNGGIKELQFSPDGFPEVVTYGSPDQDKVWRHTEGSGWSEHGTQPSRAAKERAAQRAAPPPSRNLFQEIVTRDRYLGSPVADSAGVAWLIHEGNLWAAKSGKVQKAFPEGMAHPWMSALLGLTSVNHDSQGNSYFWSYDSVSIVPKAILLIPQ